MLMLMCACCNKGLAILIYKKKTLKCRNVYIHIFSLLIHYLSFVTMKHSLSLTVALCVPQTVDKAGLHLVYVLVRVQEVTQR